MTGAISNIATPAPSASRWRVLAICLVLAAITFAVFGQTFRYDFVNYDDNEYVYDNPVVGQGLTFKGVVWAFTHKYSANWHPLTWLSHMLDCQLYGLNPGGHHLTNVILHAAAVIALFLVLRQMTGALWRSAFVAAVFAVHPLRAESVAWVAERKDVLSGLFFILTIGAYVHYARRPWSPVRYGVTALLFALGLLCKPMLVTLPLILLLLDYWPLQRKESTASLIIEKLPLLALSMASCIATLLSQRGSLVSAGFYPLPVRLGNALISCLVYLGQMVWPVGLAAFYPLKGLPAEGVLLAGLLVAGLSFFAWRQRSKWPWLLTGWFWYLVMLLPVIGIVQVGLQAHADRYTYLPQIGIYVALTWLVAEWQLSRAAMGVVMIGIIGALMVCARQQTGYWKNSETLWTHALACTTSNSVAHVNLGSDFLKRKKFDEAISQSQMGLKIRNDADAHYNLGNALMQTGSLDEAIAQCQMALQLRPNDADAHYVLGTALLQKGQLADAMAQFQAALRINPDYVEARSNLGDVLLKTRRLDEAIVEYQTVLQLKPAYAEARSNLGNALMQSGKLDEAIAQFQKALSKTNFAEVRFNLANAWMKKGQIDSAIVEYQAALKLKPDDAKANNNLANALVQKGDLAEAIVHFKRALQFDPGNPSIQNNLGWLLATCPELSLRDGAKAVELVSQADTLTGGKNPFILHTLAAALAQAGRYPEAVETAQRAARLADAQSNTGLAGALASEMKLYQAGKPLNSP